MTPDPPRSPRDLARRAEQLADDPEEKNPEVDDVKVWEAFVTGTHPTEMDTLAEEEAVRGLWLIPMTDGEAGPADYDDLDDLDIEVLDRNIREFEGYDGDGEPF